MVGPDRLAHAPAAREPQEGVSLRALLGLLGRRKLHFLIWVPLVTLAFGAAAYLLPARYAAEAVVAADPMVPEEELDPYSPAFDSERQLARITEVIYRRSLLEDVIREFDLFPASAGRVTTQEVEQLRSRIRVRAEGDRSFSLGFEDEDRQRVSAVASRLASLLIDTTRAERQERAESRTEFLAGQLPAVEARLDEQRRSIEEYKQRWFAEIPEQAPTSLKLLEGTQERLQEVSATIGEDEARLVGIDREMAELERQGVSLRPPKTPAEERLEELEVTLAQLTRRYTERHPEVVRTRAEIETLEQAMANGTGGAAPSPEYSPVQLRYLGLAAEKEAAEARLSRSRTLRGSLAGESASLQRRVEAAPRHEAALEEMRQGHAATRARYDELVTELNHARLAERREQANQRAGFRLLEPPRVPTSPVAPQRPRILLMGLLVGLGLAVGTALLAEQVDNSFRNVDEVESALGLPVLAAIPWVTPPAKRKTRGPYRSVAVLDEPQGIAAEQYRILATKLVRREAGLPRPTAVLVTSPVGAEGKSTTAVNLALVLSRMVNGEVLLVDADLRRPSVHELLRLPAGSGLGALLANPEDDPIRYVRRQHGLSIC